MSSATTCTADRRRHQRHRPTETIRARRMFPVLPLSDAAVLNTSPGGIAITTMIPVREGERLSFATDPHSPPILAEVLACEPYEGTAYRVRCRCLLGGFESN